MLGTTDLSDYRQTGHVLGFRPAVADRDLCITTELQLSQFFDAIFSIRDPESGAAIPCHKDGANGVDKLDGSLIARFEFGIGIIHTDQFHTSTFRVLLSQLLYDFFGRETIIYHPHPPDYY